MKKFWVFLALIVLTMGCSQDTTLPETPFEKTDKLLHTFTSDELKFLSMAGKETRFGQEDIDRIAGDAAGFFETFTSSSTRSSVRTVSKITPLRVDFGGATTRSEWDENVEELFYVVDFDNDAGYALISGDSRLPDEVLINVGHGSFPEGEIENPGLALMLEGAENYAAREIAKYERWRDSMEQVLIEMYGEGTEFVVSIEPQTRIRYPDGVEHNYWFSSSTTYGSWTVDTTSLITPMIPVEWGQEGVFNDRAADEEGANVAAGCVGIATIQLMAYWKRPTSFHGVTMDWDTAIQYTGSSGNRSGRYKNWLGAMNSAPLSIRNAVADYIWHIGEDVDIDWGVGNSPAVSQDAINLLSAYGFTTSSKQNFYLGYVFGSLQNNRPVYMRGNALTNSNGHAWLTDGYLNRTRPYTTVITMQVEVVDNGEVVDWYEELYSTESGVESEQYLHNNFGWDGTDNGYYVAGMFDANNDEDLSSDTRTGEDNNFQYNLEMWTNIH